MGGMSGADWFEPVSDRVEPLEVGRLLLGKERLPSELRRALQRGNGAVVPDALPFRLPPRGPERRRGGHGHPGVAVPRDDGIHETDRE